MNHLPLHCGLIIRLWWDMRVVWHFFGNAKHCERVDIQLEEREKEKTKGMEYGSTSVSVGCLVREIGELLKV